MNLYPVDPRQRRRRKSAPFLIAALAVMLTIALTLFAFSSAYAQAEPQQVEPQQTEPVQVEPVQVEPVQAEQLAAISPHLERQLAATSGPVSFLVILEDQIDAQTAVASTDTYGQDRTQRAGTLYRTLTEFALRTQAPLRTWLDENNVPYRAFYIINMIEVQGDAELAETLRNMPGVDRLIANPQVAGQQPEPTAPAPSWIQPLDVDAAQSVALPYGLSYTHAPEVWAMGYTGQGIVIASQDTGVQWDHPALIDRYRGWDATTSQATHPYNWFDAWSADAPFDPCGPDHQVPCDDHGHGTHTVGTIVGDATDDDLNEFLNPRTVIGMAPDAQWMGCRNMRGGVGTPASYSDCFQFMLAPYPQNGDPFTDGRPELAPHIINNSWSCPPSEGCEVASLRQVVETVRAAGQLIVASAGNYGSSGCQSVQYPIGIYDAVFTVGAHDSNGMIAHFSSRGPVTSDGSNRLKPDISAPGVSVLSSYPTDAGSYMWLSGTSMSSPHTAGAAALLWSAAPDLIGDIDLTEQVLIKSATPVADNVCLGGKPTSPNPTYGYGHLDVLTAVTMARTPWEVVVRVTDSAGNPQVNTRVLLVDEITKYRRERMTNGNGVVRLKPVFDGRYTLRVGRGEGSITVKGIELEPAGGPDAGVRMHRLNVTYPQPTSLDDEDFPRLKLYLPQMSR